MTHSVRSFHSGVSTVLPYTPSVASSSNYPNGNGAGQGAGQANQNAVASRRSCDMHPLFLWFSKDERLESQFQVFFADRQKRTLQRLYFALLVVLAVVLGFRIADESDDKEAVIACSIIVILCPLIMLFFSTTGNFRRWHIPATLLAGVVVSVCYLRITSYDDDRDQYMSVAVYLICAYSFLLGLTFPAVVFLNIWVVVDSMIEWSIADKFADSSDTITVLFRLIVTVVLFSYAAYRQDYLFRRVFLSTFQLRVDNKGLKEELEKLKQVEPPKGEVDLESPLAKVIFVLRELRQTAFTKMLVGKDSITRLDAAIETLVHNHDIFVPNISNQLLSGKVQMDSDTQNWLFSELASKETRASSPNTNQTQEIQRRPSLGSVVKRRRSSSGAKGLGLSPGNLRPSTEVHELNSDEAYSVTSFLESYVDQWDFNVFMFAEKCRGRPLYHLANYLFRRYQFMTKFDIDPVKFDAFLSIVESGYHSDNPYHNSTHAADVLQGTHQILVQSGLITFFDDMEILGLLVAAIVHDIDHPGRTNIFMVATESEFALTYNDKSVLENHHASTAFRVIRDPRSNILDNIPKAERKALRAQIIELVLATDLSQHFDIVGKFKSKLGSDDLRTAKENRIMIMKMIIKCADVSNPAKVQNVYQPWVSRIMEEFYNQGDEETRLSLPISPFMDRNNPTIEKCQIGFMNFIVKPLFEAWCTFIQDQSYHQIVIANKEYYESKLNATAAPAQAAAPTSGSAPASGSTPTPAQPTAAPPAPAAPTSTPVTSVAINIPNSVVSDATKDGNQSQTRKD